MDDDYKANIYEVRKYSELTFDKQIVYLAGGGLILTIGFVKDIISMSNSRFIFLLLLTWIFFSLTLVFNLFSHLSARHSVDLILDEKEEKSDKFNLLTKRINIACIVSLLLGFTSFILFVILNISYV